MIKTPFEKIDTAIRAQGFSRKTFCLTSEGIWSFDDADWNYKDIPHITALSLKQNKKQHQHNNHQVMLQ